MEPYFLDRTQNVDNTNYILKNGTKEIQKIFSIQELYTFGFSGVFHLATTYRHTYDDNDFNSLVEANINLTYQLSKLCSKNEIPLIVPGSYFQDHYQESAGNSSIYATIKNSGEAILSFMSLTSELNCAVTRQFESYGEFDHRNKLLNRIIDSSILETEVDLPATDLYLDYLNVSDICAAYLAIFSTLKKSRGNKVQKFEISGGDSLKLSQIIKLIEKDYFELTRY
jgi:nucleoside-diphosphate-sugar epimerase